MAVRISGDGSISGLTDWEATSVTHPESADTNIALANDGSVAFDSIPADIQAAIDNIPQIEGIGANVVQTFLPDTFTTSSSSYVDTTLTATITPSSDTSKILVLAAMNIRTTTTNATVATAVFRGDVTGTSILNGATVTRAAASEIRASGTPLVLDSPGVATPVTYTIGLQVSTGSGQVINASSLTLIEVAA